VIDATHGSYPGQPPARSYEIRIHTDTKPSSIAVNGRDAGRWTWDTQHAVAVLALPSESIRNRVLLEWR
jgi:hypothetical protein